MKQILEQSYQLSLVWISVSSWDHSFTVRPVLVAFPGAESPTSLSDQAGRSFDRSINLRSLFLVWISLSSWDQSFKFGSLPALLYTLEPLYQFSTPFVLLRFHMKRLLHKLHFLAMSFWFKAKHSTPSWYQSKWNMMSSSWLSWSCAERHQCTVQWNMKYRPCGEAARPQKAGQKGANMKDVQDLMVDWSEWW